MMVPQTAGQIYDGFICKFDIYYMYTVNTPFNRSTSIYNIEDMDKMSFYVDTTR